MLSAILDLFPVAIVVHDQHGRLRYANAAAREGGLDHDSSSVFVAAAAREPGVAVVGFCEGDEFCSIAMGDDVVTLIARPQERADASIAAALFGLTPAEQRIVSLLGAGNGAPRTAEILQSSLHTIHSHLKSIFAKTQTSSQNELIALVRGGLSLFGSHPIKGCRSHGAGLSSRLPIPGKTQGSGA